jgi:hypothetical protein
VTKAKTRDCGVLVSNWKVREEAAVKAQIMFDGAMSSVVCEELGNMQGPWMTRLTWAF